MQKQGKPEPEYHQSFSGLHGLKRFGANYVWLVYSVFFFVEPVIRRSLAYWLENLGLFVIFLALYICFVETKRPRIRLPLVYVIVTMGVATIHWNQGASYFFIFGAALVPFTVRTMKTALLQVLVVATLPAIEWLVLRENPINFGITSAFVLVVGAVNLFVAEQQRAQTKLRKAYEENAALAQVAERERIARDLHDVLGHTLSVIVLKAELAGRLMGRDDVRAAAEIADVEKTARAALAEVREAIGGYRAKGLQAEVDMARMMLDAAGVTLVCESMPPKLRAREETALSLAVREAVTNIVRHAQATECRMHFAAVGDGFTRLEVEDDGHKTLAREGNGIRGMRARVEEVGGRFRIEQVSGHGTRLVIELPASANA
jgi:two-component system sensor histidine kinase DesK